MLGHSSYHFPAHVLHMGYQTSRTCQTTLAPDEERQILIPSFGYSGGRFLSLTLKKNIYNNNNF